MRISLVGLAVLALVGSGVQAQTITHLQNVDVSGLEVLPAGVAVSGTNAFVAGFNNRRVLKLTALNTSGAAATILYRSDAADVPAGPISWSASTGLVSVDFQAPNRLLVAGDTFADGAMLILNADDGSVISQQAANLDGGNPLRVASAAFYGSSNIVGAFTAGTNYFQFNSTLSGLTGPGFYGGPNGAGTDNSRDLVVAADGTIYVGFNTASSIGVHRIADDGSFPFSVTGNTNTADWYTLATTGGTTLQGLGLVQYGATQYVALADPLGARIVLVDTANPSTTVTLTNAALTAPRDVAQMTVAGQSYLIVTQYDGGARVSVFGIDGAALAPATVSDWSAY